LATMAGLAMAVHQAREARTQREHAEEASSRVRSLANVALFELHDAVAKLPGSIEARKLLVDKARAYLTALEQGPRGDPGLGLDLARAHRRLGDIQGRPNTANLGDFDGALASYERSLALLQGLVGRGLPLSATELELERVSSLGRLASLQSYTARRDDARRTAEQALAVLDGVEAQEPDNTRAMLMRSGVQGVLSWVLHEQGDMAGFLAQTTAAELSLQKVLALKPDDNDAMFSLAACYARRGVYYLERDRSPESARLALQPLRQWEALVERMSALAPDNATLGGSLGESRSYIGLALQRVDEPARAIQVLHHSTDELARRMQVNPRDEHLAFVLLNSRVALALALLGQRDPAGARQQVRLALALYDAWPEPTRRTPLHLHSAAQAHFAGGRALDTATAAAPRDACNHYRESARLLQGIPGELPRSSNGELSRQDVQAALARCPG
jgi:eukaryotic-like serine/threonine-protein kinase